MIEAGACAIQIENQVSDANNVDIKMEGYCTS
jgi:isocitrate lyase